MFEQRARPFGSRVRRVPAAAGQPGLHDVAEVIEVTPTHQQDPYGRGQIVGGVSSRRDHYVPVAVRICLTIEDNLTKFH